MKLNQSLIIIYKINWDKAAISFPSLFKLENKCKHEQNNINAGIFTT